jgi:predicted RNA-binding protein with PIN domain
VFDGGKGGWPTEQKERLNGIDNIYSRLGEEADEVIKRLAEELRESAVVVTSDRELADFVTCMGATVISAGQFEGKLRVSAQTGDYMEPDDEPDRPLSTKKKGTAYRRSKRERQRQARLRKL